MSNEASELKRILGIRRSPPYLEKAFAGKGALYGPSVVDESGISIEPIDILNKGKLLTNILRTRDLQTLRDQGVVISPVNERIHDHYAKKCRSPEEVELALDQQMKTLLVFVLPIAVGCVQQKTGKPVQITSVMVCDQLPLDPKNPTHMSNNTMLYNPQEKQLKITANRLVQMAAKLDRINLPIESSIYPGIKMQMVHEDFLYFVESAFRTLDLEDTRKPNYQLLVGRGIPSNAADRGKAFAKEVAEELGFIETTIDKMPPRGETYASR